MALFNFGKKKKITAYTCNCGCSVKEAKENVTGIRCIKVLGAGCASCHQQYENAKEAVKSIGLSIEVEYVTDMAKVMEYGVMSFPALVVNEKVVATGKVLKSAEVVKLLNKLEAI